MPDAQILAMPMKFGLEFVAIIRLDRVYSKGKIFPHIVDEFNCVFLRMSVVYFQGPRPRRVIDCSVLEAFDFLTVFDKG